MLLEAIKLVPEVLWENEAKEYAGQRW